MKIEAKVAIDVMINFKGLLSTLVGGYIGTRSIKNTKMIFQQLIFPVNLWASKNSGKIAEYFCKINKTYLIKMLTYAAEKTSSVYLG